MEEFDINNTAWVVLEEQSDPIWTTGGKRDELIAEIKGVGNTTLNVVINENDNIINISKPLLSDGILSDYLDLENGCIYRNLDIDENTGLLKKTSTKEEIVINKITVGTGTNIITTQTEIKPSKITAGLRSFDSGIKFLRLNCKVPPTLSELGEINYPVFVPDDVFNVYKKASGWQDLCLMSDNSTVFTKIANTQYSEPVYLQKGTIIKKTVNAPNNGNGFAIQKCDSDGGNPINLIYNTIAAFTDYIVPETCYIRLYSVAIIDFAIMYTNIISNPSINTLLYFFNKSVEQNGGSRLYDGTYGLLQSNTITNRLFPESMIYWMGYGKASFETNEDGNSKYVQEPEDRLANDERELEDMFPVSDIDKLAYKQNSDKYLEDLNYYQNEEEALKGYNAICPFLKYMGVIHDSNKAYNWELKKCETLDQNKQNTYPNLNDILDCSYLGKTSITNLRSWMVPSKNVRILSLPPTLTTLKNIGYMHYNTNIKVLKIVSLSHYLSLPQERMWYAGICQLGMEHLIVNGQETTMVDIPNGIIDIPNLAFYKWTCITKYILPEGIKTIGWQAFTKLNCNVVLPSSITTIDQSAFINATTNVKYIVFKSIEPPTLDTSYGLFNGANTSKHVSLYVPISSLDKYKSAAGWTLNASQLIGYNMDCDPLGLISDEGPRACYCPMSNLDIINSTDYNNGIFTAKSGTAIGNTVLMRNYDSNGNYTEETWTVQSDLTISK